jgi:multiple sugar transport system permease protein
MRTNATLFRRTATTTTYRRRKGFLWQVWKGRTSYLMLLPFLIPFIVFVVIPIGGSAYLSMTKYRAIAQNPPEYIGFDNYRELLSVEIKEYPWLYDEDTGEAMFQCGRRKVPESEVAVKEAEGETCERAFMRPREVLSEGYGEVKHFSILGKSYIIGARDERFWHALMNTFTYVFVVVALNVLFGLTLALALQRQTLINMTLRTIFFLPSVTSTLAIIVVWNWVIIMLAVWGGMGYNMILFLAGLQNIGQDVYDAAMVDGASVPQRFFHITLPLLRPTLLFVIITGTIAAFQVFESVYVLFSDAETVGGVLDSGLTVVVYLYEEGFRQFNQGYAAAMAWILFIIIFILTLINLRFGRASEGD